MSTLTAMTDQAREVEVDEVLSALIDTGSCCAEVGLGGFLPGLIAEDSDFALY
ncbi:MAG: hypothetical protein IPI32_06790 [Austwickia sp.]|jgi:hypothetical protein|nr:hypothetical protein [Austwickia sp.]MBK8437238.1 hypothetical protein [Austwickia sp.]MBK9102471.1 hypothetical protein [Austwickia sp.]